MELYDELLFADFLQAWNQRDEEAFKVRAECQVEMKCYQALAKIKAILEDDQLNDVECFQKIEKIVCVLEDMGSGAGTRHDFG